MLNFIKSIYSSYFLNEIKSITRIVAYKCLMKTIWIIYKFKFSKKLKSTRHYIEKLRSEINKEKKSVFVFANGPSIADIDLQKIKELCSTGKFDLITINSYLSNSADQATPRFAVFADNSHLTNPVGQYKKDIDKCKELGINYFVPAKYADDSDINRHAYCGLCDLNSKNTSNILKPAGYYGVTAFFALSLAKMLGYKSIYICGFDNSYFLDFEVENNGNMIIKHKHYYDKEINETKVKCLYKSSSQFFFDVYRHFSFLEKITNSSENIINIAKKTYLSTIKRNFELDVYKNE